jgi:ADP-ribosyl-[dinitrogen reductase] hydrolase
MTLQALITSGGEVESFRHSLAWRLRWWLLGLPAATGWATARALVKLWIGFNPQHSGVFSAGNGPAIRAPILGATIADPVL